MELSPIEVAIQNLDKLGFFTFIIPYMITATIFYGLLRKSQLFGDPDKNVAVNAVISLSAALLVWASPVILGISIKEQLALFVLQSMAVLFAFIVGTLLLGIFIGPDLPAKLGEILGNKKTGFYLAISVIGILIGVGLLFASGLTSILFPNVTIGTIPEEVIGTIAVFAFIIIVVLIFAFIK